MSSYCSKLKKIQKILTQEFQKLVMIKKWYYQNILCAVVESQDARGKMLLIK